VSYVGDKTLNEGECDKNRGRHHDNATIATCRARQQRWCPVRMQTTSYAAHSHHREERRAVAEWARATGVVPNTDLGGKWRQQLLVASGTNHNRWHFESWRRFSMAEWKWGTITTFDSTIWWRLSVNHHCIIVKIFQNATNQEMFVTINLMTSSLCYTYNTLNYFNKLNYNHT